MMKRKRFWIPAVLSLAALGAVPVQPDPEPSAHAAHDEFVSAAEVEMGVLEERIAELKSVSKYTSLNVQVALDEQIMALQQRQQVASTTLAQLKQATGTAWQDLQADFVSAWEEVVASYEAAALVVILDAMGTPRGFAWLES